MIFRARQFEFRFPRPALIMGIVNVTPDSFSDGGQFIDADRAVEHAVDLVTQGAEIIDIGGESTRPRAAIVSADEEMARVLPVIERLRDRLSVPISIDTTKPEVARAAVAAGACIVNDIAANRTDEEMWRVVAESGAGYVIMHMQGTPQTMQENPVYENVVAEVNGFFAERMRRVAMAGVGADQILLDVGIGFGKRLEHNLDLLAQLQSFRSWQRPLMLGASRKSFMGQLLEARLEDRLAPSLACACWAVQQGVQVIRAHDVRETRNAVRMTEAIAGRK